MKKILSLILAAAMMLTIVPAFAETTGGEAGLSDLLGSLMGGSSEAGSGSGLSDLLGSLTGGSSEGSGSGLSDLLGSLMGGLGEGGIGSGLSALLNGALDKVLEKLPPKVSAILILLKNALKNEIAKIKNNSKIGELLKSLLGKIQGTRSAEGSEGSAVADLLGMLFGGSTGEMTDGDLDKWLEEYKNSPEYQDELARNATIEAHILDEFKDSLEAGDVQLICIGSGIDDQNEDGTYKYFRNLSLTNYTVEGKNLKMKNYANNVELLFLARNADGSYSITEAVSAEEGEKYAASIAAMAEKYGASLDTVNINLGLKEWAETYQMADFLRNHPEYEKIEYQGEFKTAEEMDAIASAALDAALADVDFSL